MARKKQGMVSSKMTSFCLFRDKKAKDWKESLAELGDFLKKNKQLVLLFLLGLVAFPILFFLSVSLKEATTGLMRGMISTKMMRGSMILPTVKSTVTPTPEIRISPIPLPTGGKPVVTPPPGMTTQMR